MQKVKTCRFLREKKKSLSFSKFLHNFIVHLDLRHNFTCGFDLFIQGYIDLSINPWFVVQFYWIPCCDIFVKFCKNSHSDSSNQRPKPGNLGNLNLCLHALFTLSSRLFPFRKALASLGSFKCCVIRYILVWHGYDVWYPVAILTALFLLQIWGRYSAPFPYPNSIHFPLKILPKSKTKVPRPVDYNS